MAETGLSHSALVLLAAFHATPLLVLTAAVLIVWLMAVLSGAAAGAAVLTGGW